MIDKRGSHKKKWGEKDFQLQNQGDLRVSPSLCAIISFLPRGNLILMWHLSRWHSGKVIETKRWGRGLLREKDREEKYGYYHAAYSSEKSTKFEF